MGAIEGGVFPSPALETLRIGHKPWAPALNPEFQGDVQPVRRNPKSLITSHNLLSGFLPRAQAPNLQL